MPSPSETREALMVVTADAVLTVGGFVQSSSGSGESRRAQLLDAVPSTIGLYAQGSAALAADFYDEQRALVRVSSRYRSELFLVDDTVRIRRAVAWAATPLVDGLDDAEDVTRSRLAEVVRMDVPRPFRDTVLGNRRRDPAAVGWRRVTSGSGCKFCQFLAARGAIYKHDTATFAAHANCSCSAVPVFRGGETGPEATAMQYVGTRRKRSPAQRAALRDLLNYEFPDAPG